MENSKIEWTHHTFNPWIGCSKVSPGCANCYAETMMDKRWGKVKWGPQGKRIKTSNANWRKPLAWNKAAEAAGERHRVFCASLADVFELKRDQQYNMANWRDELWTLILNTPHLDWLLLTKRPEHINYMAPSRWMIDGFPPNVWIGTSIENQETADERIPELLKIPARVRFLSIEPMLGPVDLKLYYHDDGVLPTDREPFTERADLLHWVIVGGESGPDARPMHPEWVRAIREECLDFEVPFFFKQWGEWVPSSHVTRFGIDARHFAWPWATKTSKGRDGDTTMMVKIGKKEAGRLIDGREWNEFPHLELDSHSSAE